MSHRYLIWKLSCVYFCNDKPTSIFYVIKIQAYLTDLFYFLALEHVIELGIVYTFPNRLMNIAMISAYNSKSFLMIQIKIFWLYFLRISFITNLLSTTIQIIFLQFSYILSYIFLNIHQKWIAQKMYKISISKLLKTHQSTFVFYYLGLHILNLFCSARLFINCGFTTFRESQNT